MLILIAAVMLFVSAILLLYSAVVVPFQICMWDYSDPCNTFPTLDFDMFVDTFFVVLCFYFSTLLGHRNFSSLVLSRLFRISNYGIDRFYGISILALQFLLVEEEFLTEQCVCVPVCNLNFVWGFESMPIFRPAA